MTNNKSKRYNFDNGKSNNSFSKIIRSETGEKIKRTNEKVIRDNDNYGKGMFGILDHVGNIFDKHNDVKLPPKLSIETKCILEDLKSIDSNDLAIEDGCYKTGKDPDIIVKKELHPVVIKPGRFQRIDASNEEKINFIKDKLKLAIENDDFTILPELEEELSNIVDSKLQPADFININALIKKLKTLSENKENPEMTKQTEFINESNFEFTDISSEQYRIYEFNNGKTVMIVEPLKLSVSKSGGHRVFDSSGTSHYIPQGWVHISWRSKPGQAHFVK